MNRITTQVPNALREVAKRILWQGLLQSGIQPSKNTPSPPHPKTQKFFNNNNNNNNRFICQNGDKQHTTGYQRKPGSVTLHMDNNWGRENREIYSVGKIRDLYAEIRSIF